MRWSSQEKKIKDMKDQTKEGDKFEKKEKKGKKKIAYRPNSASQQWVRACSCGGGSSGP